VKVWVAATKEYDRERESSLGSLKRDLLKKKTVAARALWKGRENKKVSFAKVGKARNATTERNSRNAKGDWKND